MNRIRNAVLKKMTEEGLIFLPETVHVVTLDFGSGIFQESPMDFTEVVLTVDVTYQSPGGDQLHDVVRIPVEGWSKSWMEIQRGILDAVNGESHSTSTPPTADQFITDIGSSKKRHQPFDLTSSITPV